MTLIGISNGCFSSTVFSLFSTLKWGKKISSKWIDFLQVTFFLKFGCWSFTEWWMHVNGTILNSPSKSFSDDILCLSLMAKLRPSRQNRQAWKWNTAIEVWNSHGIPCDMGMVGSQEKPERNLLVLIEADKITEETAFAFIYVNMLQFSLW